VVSNDIQQNQPDRPRRTLTNSGNLRMAIHRYLARSVSLRPLVRYALYRTQVHNVSLWRLVRKNLWVTKLVNSPSRLGAVPSQLVPQGHMPGHRLTVAGILITGMTFHCSRTARAAQLSGLGLSSRQDRFRRSIPTSRP
jgi:hypothetical protein